MDAMHRNRSFGWWSLLCWLSLGMVLEAMHGFKIGWYLDVVNEARRLQLSLAHSHGTLLALVNLAFVATAQRRDGPPQDLARAGWYLRGAGFLMPLGFLLGGVFVVGPDPGFSIVLMPIGGLMLFLGVLSTVRAVGAAPTAEPGPTTQGAGDAKTGPRSKSGR